MLLLHKPGEALLLEGKESASERLGGFHWGDGGFALEEGLVLGADLVKWSCLRTAKLGEYEVLIRLMELQEAPELMLQRLSRGVRHAAALWVLPRGDDTEFASTLRNWKAHAGLALLDDA
jgi:hypothetical protein